MAAKDLFEFPISLTLQARHLLNLGLVLARGASFFLDLIYLDKNEATCFYFTFAKLLAWHIPLLQEQTLQFLFHLFRQRIYIQFLEPRLLKQLFLKFRLSNTLILCQSKMDLYKLFIINFLWIIQPHTNYINFLLIQFFHFFYNFIFKKISWMRSPKNIYII